MENRLFYKNILLISPVYFNYYKEMISSLENMGAIVDWYDERPSNNFFVKSILRVNENLIKSNLESYYDKIIEKIKDKRYKYILIIKPEGIPVSSINKIKKMNPDAKVVMMLWDSIANNKAAIEKIKYADKVFSFDKNDCEKYKLTFRPLFYIEKYSDIANSKVKYEQDLLFVGTVHSDRYKILMNLKNKLEEQGHSCYFYMYIPYKIFYRVRKVLFNEFSGSSIDEFKFKPLSQGEIVDLVRKSRVVLDIQHPKQTGLTMRTIEMLGADKKILTTNNDIINYDFYNKDNIQLVDRDISDLDFRFFHTKYNKVPKEIKHNYSLESWLLELLN